MENATHETDVLVIGGGPAGYTAAIRASQLGVDATLVERQRLGGACLNHGCIPSKALISATDLAHRAGAAASMGIEADPTIDVSRLISWKDDIVTQLTDGVGQVCEANGVTLIDGEARLTESGTALVEADTGGEATISYEHVVIATGSRPIELPTVPFDTPGVIDSREALALEEAPDRLVIVGAGYIGMELAGVFAKMGSDVTVIEMLEKPLPQYDRRLTHPVRRRARELAVELRLQTVVSGVSPTGSEIAVALEDADPVSADTVLVAVGRTPVTDTVGLANIGLEPTESGAIPVDDRRETPVDNVYAVGDVTGDPMLAHVGIAEGIVAAAVIAGEEATFDPRAIPEVVFTDPEVAQVGARPDELDSPIIGMFPLRANGRALTLEQPDGMVRIVADEQGHVRGGAVVGPEASELIGEIGLAVELEAHLEDIASTIHAHPTLSEAIMEAAGAAQGRAIHRQNR